MLGICLQMVGLDLFFQLLKAHCHVNQYWAKLEKMTFIQQAAIPKWQQIWQFQLQKCSMAIF